MIKLVVLIVLFLLIIYCGIILRANYLSPEMYENFDANFTKSSDKCDSSNGDTCNIKSCGIGLFPIMDPEFNMREVAKQCLLLEDHMNNTKKRCMDCIRKHFLIIDGLLEEAISLERSNDARAIYRNYFLQWVALEREYAQMNNIDQLDEVSKKIRAYRKPLVEKYFDKIAAFDLSDVVSSDAASSNSAS